QNYAEIRSRQIFSFSHRHRRRRSRSACRFITIHTDGHVSTKRLCDFQKDREILYHNLAPVTIFPARAMKSQIKSLTFFGVVLMIFFGASASAVLGDEHQQSFSFQVPKSDSAKAEALADQLATLSPRVDRKEAKLLAECAYATVSQLR